MLPNVLKQQRLPEGQASLCFTHNLHYNFIVLLPLLLPAVQWFLLLSHLLHFFVCQPKLELEL